MNRGTRVTDKRSQRRASYVRLSEHTQASDFSGETVRRITKAALGGLAGCALVLGGTQAASGACRLDSQSGISRADWPLTRTKRPLTGRTEPMTGAFDSATGEAQGDRDHPTAAPPFSLDVRRYRCGLRRSDSSELISTRRVRSRRHDHQRLGQLPQRAHRPGSLRPRDRGKSGSISCPDEDGMA